MIMKIILRRHQFCDYDKFLSQILNPLEIQGNSEGYAFEVSMAIVFAPVGLNTPEWNYAAEMYTDQ